MSSDLEADLKRTRDVLAELASAANHDLNAPLRHIHMFAELIQRDHGEALPDGVTAYLDRILESVDRSERLVSALVDYARLASTPPALERIDLNAIAGAAAAPFESAYLAAGGAIELGPLPIAKGEAERLERVFTALFDNALKYRAHCLPVVHVAGLPTQDSHVRVRVADQGPGLPAAHSDVAFELLRRLTGANDIEGEGVGLALCRLVIETHGGRIEHDPSHNHGTAFEFTLPAAD